MGIGCYELACIDLDGFFKYYYFISFKTIKTPKSALNRGYAPDKIKILVRDREEKPASIKLYNPLTYVYNKYLKKGGFIFGRRVNWEKEEI